MMTTPRRLLAVSCLIAISVQLSGCTWTANCWDSWFGPKKPYELRIYRFSSRPNQDTKNNRVEYLPGKFIYLNHKPVVSSKDMRHVEAIDNPNGKGKSLAITLDGHGRSVWTQLTAVHRGEQVVCMLDGDYMGPIELTKLNETGLFIIPGPFTEDEAKKIVENASDFRD